MEDFETYLKNATAKGANIVPGAVMAVVDEDGNFIYKKAAGYNGVSQDAKLLEFDQTFFIASCTKLITAIAALQMVECGLVSLDEPVDKILPELASQPIIKSHGSEISLRQGIKAITLRQLITHSSGATYDWVDRKLYQWRALRGETPTLISGGDVAKGYAYPRTFEAGDSWQYSGGFDWASLLVERLHHTSFEEYVEDNIAKPLGITTFTWHLSKKPAVEASLMNMSTRQENGVFTDGPTPIWPDPVKEGGGAGLYSSIQDYTRVLSDLLKQSPTLLKKETVDQMFAPQFAEGSSTLKDLISNGEDAYQCALDFSMEGVSPNFGLGSMLLMEDVTRKNYFKPKGTLTWTGMPNLLWSINRERGMALIFATQVLPWADKRSFDLIARFETAVWQNLSSKTKP
ncbi:beta-lactamase class C and other penicillin binding protein [Pyrenochaeta sp. DS3sAY3a]|nr:beta-lactamase class C and other penicillin binding protein [Pyrenochaeta sp. DS3sAY3a]